MLFFDGNSQNLVYDSIFNVLAGAKDVKTPFLWSKGDATSGNIRFSQEGNSKGAVFQFKVSSVQVDPNYVLARLTDELETGSSYQFDIWIKKDRFSPFRIKEFQAYLGASNNTGSYFTHGSWDRQLVTWSLDSTLTADFIKLTAIYEAIGGEEFIYLGSLRQSFGVGESNRLGLLMADRTYQDLAYNSTYYVSKICVKKIQGNAYEMKNCMRVNYYNLKSQNNNLIVNGGGESPLKKRHYLNGNTIGSTGTQIAPYAYSLSQFCPKID